ncbi:hypothetical protein BHM03_00048372, partial [Ensete ventricosum]
ANSLANRGSRSEERYTEQDEREVGYSPRGEEASSEAPIEKKSHKERIITAETRLDVLEASVEELYQGQQRLLGVESSQEKALSRIEKVESLIDQLTEDTKDSVRHLHEGDARKWRPPTASSQADATRGQAARGSCPRRACKEGGRQQPSHKGLPPEQGQRWRQRRGRQGEG